MLYNHLNDRGVESRDVLAPPARSVSAVYRFTVTGCTEPGAHDRRVRAELAQCALASRQRSAAWAEHAEVGLVSGRH